MEGEAETQRMKGSGSGGVSTGALSPFILPTDFVFISL